MITYRDYMKGQPLSPQEQTIIDLIMQGKSQNKELAHILGISERTIQSHLRSIYAKHDVDSKINLVIKLCRSEKGS